MLSLLQISLRMSSCLHQWAKKYLLANVQKHWLKKPAFQKGDCSTTCLPRQL
jgi:hypothetical protein